jgi:restriction endonuclease Mrr
LARLMVQHDVGVCTRTTYEVKKVDEDYFTE